MIFFKKEILFGTLFWFNYILHPFSHCDVAFDLLAHDYMVLLSQTWNPLLTMVFDSNYLSIRKRDIVSFRCFLLILSIASSATRVRDLHHCLNFCCVAVTVFYSINLFQRSLCWLLRLALFFSNVFVTSCFWACWLNELVWDAFALSIWWILGFLALWQLVFEWLKFYVMVESKGAGCWCFVIKLLVVVFAFKGLIFNILFIFSSICYDMTNNMLNGKCFLVSYIVLR